jgi:hypothetical protein
MRSKEKILSNCQILLKAYREGKLGYMKMPEDTHPSFNTKEERLTYFTLPMALNYQRDSYKLWESVLKTYNDPRTKFIFDIKTSANFSEEKLREYLIKYKIALQPNKHIATWQKISRTILNNWGSISEMFKFVDYDFLKLKNLIQVKSKKGFPYLSGPKIFNYWSFIIQEYGKIKLKNSEYIEIAPDTHITKCSVILGIISKEESEILSKDQISERWRNILLGSNINPIDMHPPLWFWSRNGFKFKLD